MKVTVCTMNYNLGSFIGETIKSVLSQTFTDFEYLIYDDCSTDNSLAVIRSFDDPRIRVIVLPENKGSSNIINLAMKEAKGEYLSIIASDDMWEPTYLEKAIGKLEKDPLYGAAFSHVTLIDEDSKLYSLPHHFDCITSEPNRTQEEWIKILYSGNRLLGTMTMRLSIKAGEWDGELGQLTDLDFFIRLIKETPIYILQEKLVKIRIRGMQNASSPTPENIIKHVKYLGIIQRKYYRQYNAENLNGKTKLILATPFYEMKGFSPYIRSLVSTVEWLTSEDINWEFWDLSGDSYVDRARNTLCARFLESDGTHLLLIDSDEEWDCKAIPKMMAADKEIIGGAYPQKNNWDTWSSIPYAPEGKIQGILSEDGKQALVEAECVSAGFMMIKRSAFEEFEKYYPEFSYSDISADPLNSTRIYIAFFECFRDKGRRFGEDYTFCNRWRAMGKKLYIYPDIEFGHYGVKGWHGNYDRFLRSQPKG